MRKILIIVSNIPVLLFMVIFMSGCSRDSNITTFTSDPTSDIIFPRQAPPIDGEYVFMEALIHGKLIVDNQCLVLATDTDGFVTPIWPDYYHLVFNKDELHIVRDSKTEIIIGNLVKLGGGMTDDLTESDVVVSPKCPKPFWIVGELY